MINALWHIQTFAAFNEILISRHDRMQHPLPWAVTASGCMARMLAAIKPLYVKGTLSMKICGSSGASGATQDGVRQPWLWSPLPAVWRLMTFAATVKPCQNDGRS